MHAKRLRQLGEILAIVIDDLGVDHIGERVSLEGTVAPCAIASMLTNSLSSSRVGSRNATSGRSVETVETCLSGEHCDRGLNRPAATFVHVAHRLSPEIVGALTSDLAMHVAIDFRDLPEVVRDGPTCVPGAVESEFLSDRVPRGTADTKSPCSDRTLSGVCSGPQSRLRAANFRSLFIAHSPIVDPRRGARNRPSGESLRLAGKCDESVRGPSLVLDESAFRVVPVPVA